MADPEVHDPKAIRRAMVPIMKAKPARIPFPPQLGRKKMFATNQTMFPIFCLCFSVQTFVNRSELERGGDGSSGGGGSSSSSSNGFKRQSQDQMKAKETHTYFKDIRGQNTK